MKKLLKVCYYPHLTRKYLFLSFFYERSSLAPLVGKWEQVL